MWTRKLTLIGGKTALDDWLILCQGEACGRVYLTLSPVTAQRTIWAWAAWSYPGGNGRCDTLDEACDLVRAKIIAAGGRMCGKYPDIAL